MGALVFTGVGPSRTALAVTAVADVWVHRLKCWPLQPLCVIAAMGVDMAAACPVGR